MNFSDFFSQLFTDLTTEDSILVLVILLGAFLIGLIAGVLAGRSGVGRLRRALREKEQQRLAMQAEKQAAEEQLELQEADLQRAENEWREQRERSERLEEEKADLQNDLLQANEQMSRLQAKINADSALMEDLHNQILGLKAKNSQLSAALDGDGEAAAAPAGFMEELSGRLEKLEQENREMRRRQEQLTSSPEGGEADLAALQEMEEKLDRLEREHAGLRSLGEKLSRLEQENASLKAVAVKLQKLESEHAQLQQLQEKLAALEQAQGGVPASPKSGSGGQAEISLRVYKDPLDLKIIQGIDSATEEVIKKGGVENWMDLSRIPMEKLHGLLREAGGEIAAKDPATWPEQARLATEGRWQELQDYQAWLQRGGKEGGKNSAD